jgi:ABC-type molybdenum transport system ATPase subunit/photorepair protein PhrA
VTHYPHEIPTCMTHMLQFEKTTSGRYQAGSRRL